MNKKIIYALVGLALIFFLTSLVIFLKSNRESRRIASGEIDKESVGEVLKPEFVQLKAFFYKQGSRYMRPVPYETEQPEIKQELYRKLLERLLRGEEEYIKPIPEGVRLRTLYYIEKENLLILDFNEELLQQFPAGTSTELEFIYFIVDNLCFNFQEIKKVKFLVAGNNIKTLSGHIDMEHPFYPDYRYLIDK